MNMKDLMQNCGRTPRRNREGMTLVEVVLSLAISAVAVAGIISGYIFSMASAQKWALSLAANAKAMERIEETRGARWNISIWPSVDQLVATNFPDQLVILDHSASGGGIVYATNITQISDISADPPLKRIRVDCIWTFKGSLLFTNTIETCRGPKQ
jgi:prepilin-type N-terminal cleavage/methylation domain-containing protein